MTLRATEFLPKGSGGVISGTWGGSSGNGYIMFVVYGPIKPMHLPIR